MNRRGFLPYPATIIILPVVARIEARQPQEHLRENRDNIVILPVVRIERPSANNVIKIETFEGRA